MFKLNKLCLDQILCYGSSIAEVEKFYGLTDQLCNFFYLMIELLQSSLNINQTYKASYC